MTAGYGLAGKRVELHLRETERTAAAHGLDLRAFEVRGPLDLPGVFAAIADWRSEGLLTLADGMFFSQRERIVELALKNKLPGVYPEAEFVTPGGLASYGPSLPELFRQAAAYVDKILKGAKPADLPIEQPSKFELIVNPKSAQTLGLTISREFQLRADEVIE